MSEALVTIQTKSCKKDIYVVKLYEESVLGSSSSAPKSGDNNLQDVALQAFYKRVEESKMFAEECILLFLIEANRDDEYDIDVLAYLSRKFDSVHLLTIPHLEIIGASRELMSFGYSIIERYSTFEEIANCTRVLTKNRYYTSPRCFEGFLSQLLVKKEDEHIDTLTQRQRQIIQLLSQGKTYKEIASLLFISYNTVGYHAKQIYKKLEVTNKAQAIRKYLS